MELKLQKDTPQVAAPQIASALYLLRSPPASAQQRHIRAIAASITESSSLGSLRCVAPYNSMRLIWLTNRLNRCTVHIRLLGICTRMHPEPMPQPRMSLVREDEAVRVSCPAQRLVPDRARAHLCMQAALQQQASCCQPSVAGVRPSAHTAKSVVQDVKSGRSVLEWICLKGYVHEHRCSSHTSNLLPHSRQYSLACITGLSQAACVSSHRSDGNSICMCIHPRPGMQGRRIHQHGRAPLQARSGRPGCYACAHPHKARVSNEPIANEALQLMQTER